MYRPKQLGLDDLVSRLNFESKNLILAKKNSLLRLKNSHVLLNPKNITEKKANRLLQSMNKLEVLNPLLTVKRGYTLTKKEGKVISSSKDLKKGDKLEVEFKDGSINTEVI